MGDMGGVGVRGGSGEYDQSASYSCMKFPQNKNSII